MKRSLALAGLAVAALTLPAGAANQFVQDGASMFSGTTVAALEQRIATLQSSTGKEVVVVTVPSLTSGETVAQAAQTVFDDQHINGVLIFIAKSDRRDIIVPGTATSQFFNASTNNDIRQAMEAQFKAGNYDEGIAGAVTSIVDLFNAHANTAPNNQSNGSYVATTGRRHARTSSGGGIPVFLWIIIILVGFMILRSIMRAASGPRYYGGGQPGPGYGGGYGGGYGPGYGGGGGFWSGLLGGLGGAWLGNEMFGNRGGNIVDGGSYDAGNQNQGGGWGDSGGGNSGGWGSDSGADMGNSSGGDFSGGGFGGDGGSGGDGGGGGW
jgi:uncharacterized membrane protein YgcG